MKKRIARLSIRSSNPSFTRQFGGNLFFFFSFSAIFLVSLLLGLSSAVAVTWPIERQYLEAPSPIPSEPGTAPNNRVDLATGIDLQFIPAGCFEMGNADVGAVGEVCVDAFYLSRHEVTNGQFRRFRSTHGSGSYKGHDLNRDSQPVVNISWHDAVAFAGWLSDLTGQRFRLATEAEWEYACQAERREILAEVPDTMGNLRVDTASASGTLDKASVAIGSFTPGPFDLYDMHGNASEWVLDAYIEGAGRFGRQTVNPFVDIEGNALRVRRGGSWNSSTEQAHCSARDYYVGDLVVPHTGFRIVQETSAQ